MRWPQTILNCLAVIEGAETKLTPSQIGERTLTSSATMTNTLDTLEHLGLGRVESRTPTIGAASSSRSPPRAKPSPTASCPASERWRLAALGELTGTERATLLKLLGKVLKGMAAIAAAEPIPLEGRRNRPAAADPAVVNRSSLQPDGFGCRLAYSAASSVREWRPVLAKTWSRWVLTVALPMRRRSAICGLVRPSATSATTCCSVGVSAAQPWLGRFR